jgi:AraC family transcriptional regulator
MESRLRIGDYYGRIARRHALNGLLFSESVYAPGARLPTHAHENAFFHLVVAGSSMETRGGTTRKEAPGALVLHPAGEAHSNVWRDGGRCFHLEIDPARIAGLFDGQDPLSEPADWERGLAPWLARRIYREFVCEDDLSPLALEGLALELIAEVTRFRSGSNPSVPAWLRTARELIHDRFAEPLTLEVISAETGVHPAHLARTFRRHYHCTVGDYLRQLRVEAACRALASSQAALVEVALAAGFADQSHFTHSFKRATGMTPGEFRKNRR